MRRSLAFSAAAAVIACFAVAVASPVPPARAETATDAAALLQPLRITTRSGVRTFMVELARTEPERERGLMFRRFMPPDRGMLFDFKVDRSIMMWMKNTYIPLDMIFIGRDGRITALAENTEPLSESIISSNGPAYAVLELNAGAIAAAGVAVGDAIAHPLFPAPR